MNRTERAIASIDRGLQDRALVFVNAVREYLGAPALKRLPVRGAGNSISSTPIALAIWGLFEDDPAHPHTGFPSGYHGNIKRLVGGAYTGVWEVKDEKLGRDLARIFGTKWVSMKMLEYCCHRHFDESEMVVVLPKELREYESAVVEAADAASECEECGRKWYE